MASSDSSSGADGERDVFGSLPTTRPHRRSAKRARAGGEATAAAPPAVKAKPKAKARPKARASAKGGPAATPRAGAPASTIPPAGYATPGPGDDGVPKGADLVTTAVQAAGELAHIGIAAGCRALKSALQRLPRP